MEEDDGKDDSEGHVCEFVEEKFEERSGDFCCWEDNPVCQVSDVIFFVFALECEEGEVGWYEVADEAGHDGVGFEDGAEYE